MRTTRILWVNRAVVFATALALIAMMACASRARPADNSQTPTSANGAPGSEAPKRSEIDEPPDAAVNTPAVQLVTVTVVSADVEGLMPNGQQWDGSDAKARGAIDKVIALYLNRHPELERTRATVGIPIEAGRLANEAASSHAADPMVIVQLADHVYRTPLRPRSFHPVWDFPFQFAISQRAAPDTQARILVVDYDSADRFDVMGSTLVSVQELMAKTVHRLGPFGSVKQLTLEVNTTALPEPLPAPSEFRIAVPSTKVWTDTGIELIAGQRVTVDAADEVCTDGDSLRGCNGPEGKRHTSDHNLPGFASFRHGALVGAVGDTRFLIGRETQFVAPSSGRFRLGVNDHSTKDNRGAYAVRIKVAPL